MSAARVEALRRWGRVQVLRGDDKPLPDHGTVYTVMPRCRCRLGHPRAIALEECPAHPELGSQR